MREGEAASPPCLATSISACWALDFVAMAAVVVAKQVRGRLGLSSGPVSLPPQFAAIISMHSVPSGPWRQ